MLTEVFVLETEDGGTAVEEQTTDQSEQIASLLLDLQTDDAEDTESPTRESGLALSERWSRTEHDTHRRPTTEYNKVGVCLRAYTCSSYLYLRPVISYCHNVFVGKLND